jgi:uncharacterized protein (DUF488 family)
MQVLSTMYTIGHSTRSLQDFLALLRLNNVVRLADIRRFPGSRRHPHFSREALEVSLPNAGVEYVHFEELGGRRRPLKNSPNTAWDSDQFRGYADHMATPAFQEAVDRLLATDRTTAVMCAESVPWRCHRNLLSDELVRRGVTVLHIVGAATPQPHELSRMARITGDRVIYPAEQQTIDFGRI